jgi:Tfp pilus assembly protein PilV
MRIKLNQRGIAIIEVLIALVMLIAIAAGGYYIYQQRDNQASGPTDAQFEATSNDASAAASDPLKDDVPDEPAN